MGFVINQRAAAKHYNPQLTTTEETKPSDGYHNRKERCYYKRIGRSRSRSHDGKESHRHSKKYTDYKSSRCKATEYEVPIPEHVKRVPTSWKECKKKNIEICQIRRIKDLYESKEESP